MTGEAATALARLLKDRIRATGPLSVAEFMEAALGHPRYGYYTTRDPLGAGGDFVTAPEVSQMFGELIGLWCVDLWQRMESPDPFILAELGPGRGTLMADALRAGGMVPAFRRALRLHLVETSPVLRRLQAAALGPAQPSWHEDAGALPPGPMLLIANEFLDALPIRQFERSQEGWHERRIGLGEDGETLAFLRDPAPCAVPDRGRPPGDEPGAVRETCPAALDLAGALGRRLAREGGAALFIDYGYFPSACGDTLQALRRHRFDSVLAAPGSADLTAHVDFAAIAGAAREGGARVHGPVSQAGFLRALGIELRVARLVRGATPAQAEAVVKACNRLLDPAQMGSLFKVLAVTHPDLPVPAGFPPPTA